MFFVLSQIASWIILPLSQLLVLLTGWLFIRNGTWKRYFRNGFLFLLLLYTSPLTSHFLIRWWEIPATPYEEIDEIYDLGVVLTGMTKSMALPPDRPHFSEAGDRMIDAVTLYKKGLIKKIIISGGSGNLFLPEVSESPRLREFAIVMGVHPNDVIVEGTSRNTRQNAVHSMQLVKTHWNDSKYLLITSAIHMRRAAACFRKAGGDPVIFSTDIQSSPFVWDPRGLIPNINAVYIWTAVEREMFGYVVYWLAGYI